MKFRQWLHRYNPSRLAIYAAIIVVVIVWCCASSVQLWSFARRHSTSAPGSAGVPSGTIVEISVGLTAVALALAIMLGQMYSEHAGRLRVFLHASRVEPSLVATVTTSVVAAVIPGKFYILPASIGLGAIAILSCSSILKVLHLLQHDEQFIEAWKTFTISRQRRIASQSASRQMAATTASAAISGWGSDVKIEDRLFELFHAGDLNAYIKVAAGNVGQVDVIDLSSLHRLLDILRKSKTSRTDKDSAVPTHADALSSAALVASSSDPCPSQPILIICHLPGSTVSKPSDGLAFFRTDAVRDPRQRTKVTRALRHAFRIDASEQIPATITDLQSETTELCDDLRKGVLSNDRQPVERFRQMSSCIVAAAGTISGLDIPDGIVHDDCTYRIRALARATDDARRSVENPATKADRSIEDLVLSLPGNLAQSAAETENPEAFKTCLLPLLLRCEEALKRDPAYRIARHQGLSQYGILSWLLQHLAEQRISAKTDIKPIIAEAKLLLQNLSSLLLSSVRSHNWAAAAAVLEEMSALEPTSAGAAKNQTAYATEFRRLVSLAYYGLHACLVDLAIQDTTIVCNDLTNLIKRTRPDTDVDLPPLLGIYNMAKAEADADAAQDWGWEPEPVSGVAFFPRTDEILIRGFVATVITRPEFVSFKNSDADAWEQAAGGASELGQLFGTGGLLDKILKNAGEIAKLVAATGQDQDRADRAVGALRKLLDYVQAKTADEERARIPNARVSVEAIQGWPESVVQEYDASHKSEITKLEKLRLLWPAGDGSTAVEDKKTLVFGFNRVEPKEWFLPENGPASWEGVAREYAEGLLTAEQDHTIIQLSKIGSPVGLTSVLTSATCIRKATVILAVNSGVYLLGQGLDNLVERPGSASPDDGGPDAFLKIAGGRIPMYQFFGGQGMKPCLLFINPSNTAHVLRVPWKDKDGWTLSRTGEVKARLRVPSQDDGAMKELLEQHAPWLEKEAHTDEEKKAYLSRLVWSEAYLRFALDAGANPNILRLDLPEDEPEAPSQTKDTPDDNAGR